MTFADAKRKAKAISDSDGCLSYRNVWGFFNDSDSEIQAIFITKDNADTEISGIFLDKGEENGFTEYETNRIVPMNSVFGKTFFDDDPSLLTDPTPEDMPIDEKISTLFRETAELLIAHGLPAGALILLHDIADRDSSDDATILLRLVILKNYLSKTDKHISVEEFAFMHHELFTI